MMLERLIQRVLEEGGVFQRVDETVSEFKKRAHGPERLTVSR
jgi:hypothetical protein